MDRFDERIVIINRIDVRLKNQCSIMCDFLTLPKPIQSCSSEAMVGAVVQSRKRQMQVIADERKAISCLEILRDSEIGFLLKFIVSTIQLLLYQVHLISEHFLNK